MFDRDAQGPGQRLFLNYLKKIVGLPCTNIVPSELVVDVLIPATSKDIPVLPLAVQGVQRNLLHPLGNIFIPVPKNDIEITRNAVRWLNVTVLDEREVLPCPRECISYHPCGTDRTGWLIQQLIKLNGWSIVSKSHYFVIDADTVLVRKQKFEQAQKYVMLASDEFHFPYYKVFYKIFGYRTPSTISCVAHMMLFDVCFLKKMLKEVEGKHLKEWWMVFEEACDKDSASGFSEYEMYGHWMRIHNKKKIIREYFYNLPMARKYVEENIFLEKKYGDNFRSVSFQSYL